MEKIKQFGGWMLILALSAPEAGARTPCESALRGRKIQPEEAQTAQTWNETGLKASLLFKQNILGPHCLENAKTFTECVVLLDAMARFGQPAYAVIPKPVLSAFQEVTGIEKEFGQLSLVRIDKNWSQPVSGSLKKDNELIFERKKLYLSAVEALFAEQKEFQGAIDGLLEHILTPQFESLQVAAGMTALLRLTDSHAMLRPEDEMIRAAAEGGNESWVGIGVQLEMQKKNRVVVSRLVPGGPAQKAGLRVGDELLKINSEGRGRRTPTEFIDLLSGRRGGKVALTVRRGNRTHQLVAVRAEVRVKNVGAELIESARGNQTAVIHLRSFENQNACEEIKSEIDRLTEKGATRIVLNLSGNGGGLVNQALCISGLFVGKKLISSIRSLETGETEDLKGTHAKITDLPMVVLIDSKSASASELVAGALRDHQRAWLLGERSFGKGSVQSGRRLIAEDSQKLGVWAIVTTNHFYQPDGTSNQLHGILPNFIEPKAPGEALDEDALREEDVSPLARPAVGRKRWRETRASQVRDLKKCMDTEGLAADRFHEKIAKGEAADYRLERALDLLDCLEP